jgi:dimeric dUTPase (all-alpha-NTP-PPase superfamily)
MKKTYKVKYKHGLVGDSIVVASNRRDAIKEAYALCLFYTCSIPLNFKMSDIIQSVEPTDINPGTPGYQYRAVVEVENLSEFVENT